MNQVVALKSADKPGDHPDSTQVRLKSFIERVERLEEEKKGIADDIKDVYAEAKGTGFDVKIMRKVISLRKMAADDRREQEELIETYMAALGMTI
jgi:uncharacterized protein (UPF0335 family)